MLAGWKRPEQKKRSQVLNIKHRSSRLISGTDGLDVGHYIKAGAGEPHSSAANGKLIGGRGALLRKGGGSTITARQVSKPGTGQARPFIAAVLGKAHHLSLGPSGLYLELCATNFL